MAKILYISYDGMTDSLGQSQVIPYLIGLSEKGHQIKLLSCEKKENYRRYRIEIEELLFRNSIEWKPISYTKSPPVLSKIWDVWKMKRVATSAFQNEKIDIVHCRSYMAALAGLFLQKKFGVRFVFDMRGFWADERVDGKIWNLQYPFYKWIYHFFKKKEKAFLTKADYIVCLTHRAKAEILNWNLLPAQPIEVIPCCVDTTLFSDRNVDEHIISRLRQRLGIHPDDFTLVYLGAIGTWYMADEMLDFFKCLLKERPTAKFLWITTESPDTIKNLAAEKEISLENIVVQSAKRKEVPLYLCLANLAIFFIQPAYSKIASSPTKLGELMSMGIPVICNAGVGDTDSIISDSGAGLLVQRFTESDYLQCIAKLSNILPADKSQIVSAAHRYFSLESGIGLYDGIYSALTKTYS